MDSCQGTAFDKVMEKRVWRSWPEGGQGMGHRANGGQGSGGRVLRGRQEGGKADLLARGSLHAPWPDYKRHIVERAQDVKGGLFQTQFLTRSETLSKSPASLGCRQSTCKMGMTVTAAPVTPH